MYFTRAETLKLQKYSDLATEYVVSPLAFETPGGPGSLTRNLRITVAQLLQVVTGNRRAEEFLLQRLSLEDQRGNAAAVMNTTQEHNGPVLGLPGPRT